MEVLISILVAIGVIVVPVVVIWGSINAYELFTGRDL